MAVESLPLVIPNRPTSVSHYGVHRAQWFDSAPVTLPPTEMGDDEVTVNVSVWAENGVRLSVHVYVDGIPLTATEARRYGEALLEHAALAESVGLT